MQRILRGELPFIRVTVDHDPRPWSYGFCHRLEIWIDLVWWHYEETHGLPRTPWYDEAFNNVTF